MTGSRAPSTAVDIPRLPLAAESPSPAALQPLLPILAIGPRIRPTKIGGATVSFENLLASLAERNLDVEILDIAYEGRIAGLKSLARVVLTLLSTNAKTYFLNVSKGGARVLVPLAALCKRLRGKHLVVRFFGGDIARAIRSEHGFLERFLYRAASRQVDLCLLQTQELVRDLQGYFPRIHWFPSSREQLASRPSDRPFQGRFVYVGQVTKAKGALVLDELYSRLPPQTSLSVYGPIVDEDCRFIADRPYYRGVLDHDSVQRTLADFDVFLLPTSHEGEGYPGALIEAFMVGLPCVVTNWKALPEIAKDGVNGYLVECPTADSLLSAMQQFSPENYPKLSQAAHSFASGFHRPAVTERLLKALAELSTSEIEPSHNLGKNSRA